MPARDSPEARVVHSLKQHLLAEGLCGGRVSEVIVDADGAYQASSYARALEPMATVWIDGFRPDLVCSVRRESYCLVAGFEVKADLADWPKGVTQASAYRNGVHHAFLALPFSANARIRSLDQQARDRGIGVLQLDGSEWREAIPPADPRPLPWSLQATSLALAGVPAARKLQLNHPLNYLVVPYLRMLEGESPLLSLLERHWPDLKQVFLRDPEQDLSRPFRPSDFRSATVFQFKQILWHAGISAAKAHSGASGGAARYQPDRDEWQLDEQVLKRPLRTET